MSDSLGKIQSTTSLSYCKLYSYSELSEAAKQRIPLAIKESNNQYSLRHFFQQIESVLKKSSCNPFFLNVVTASDLFSHLNYAFIFKGYQEYFGAQPSALASFWAALAAKTFAFIKLNN